MVKRRERWEPNEFQTRIVRITTDDFSHRFTQMNGANGMSDIEGKAAMEAAREVGAERVSNTDSETIWTPEMQIRVNPCSSVAFLIKSVPLICGSPSAV